MNPSRPLSALPTFGTQHWLELGILLFALLTLWIFIRAGRHLRHRRLGRAAGGATVGLLFGGITGLILLLGLNALTYSRLTEERPVATIRFKAAGPQTYIAILRTAAGRTVHTRISGDEWELDARVIKWTGVGTLLGLPPLYRLERLAGRYENFQEARTTLPTMVRLSGNPGIPLDELGRYAPWFPLVDARYGSATYLPMADNAEYRVSISATGLLARPGNKAAQAALLRWQ